MADEAAPTLDVLVCLAPCDGRARSAAFPWSKRAWRAVCEAFKHVDYTAATRAFYLSHDPGARGHPVVVDAVRKVGLHRSTTLGKDALAIIKVSKEAWDRRLIVLEAYRVYEALGVNQRVALLKYHVPRGLDDLIAAGILPEASVIRSRGMDANRVAVKAMADLQMEWNGRQWRRDVVEWAGMCLNPSREGHVCMDVSCAQYCVAEFLCRRSLERSIERNKRARRAAAKKARALRDEDSE